MDGGSHISNTFSPEGCPLYLLIVVSVWNVSINEYNKYL